MELWYSKSSVFAKVVTSGTETIDGSVEKHLEYRREVGMKCSIGLVFLELLLRVVHSLPGRELSRKGREIVVSELASKNLFFTHLGSLTRSESARVKSFGLADV